MEDEDRAAREEEGSDDPPARGRGRGRGRKGKGKGRSKTGGKNRGPKAAEKPTDEPGAKKQKVDVEPKQSVALSDEREKMLDQPDQTMAEVPQDSQPLLHACEVPTPEAAPTEADAPTPEKKTCKAKAKSKKPPLTPKRKTKSLVSPKKADRGSKDGEGEGTGGMGETESTKPQASPNISKSAKKRNYVKDTFPAEILHTHACIPVLSESDINDIGSRCFSIDICVKENAAMINDELSRGDHTLPFLHAQLPADFKTRK